MARIGIPRRVTVRVLLRDHFRCRYCGTDVIFTPALKALSARHPGLGYYDKNGHRERMSKMLLDRSYCLDHVVPVEGGGTNETSNLVCACWSCNLRKSNDRDPDWSSRLQASHGRTPGWDGMLSVLRDLDPDDPWLPLFDSALEGSPTG